LQPSRWDRLEELLELASSIPPDERAVFVERETSRDPALGAELSALLDASDGAAEYLGRLRHELLGSDVRGMLRHPPADDDLPDPWIGRTISHYEILERLGGGGMGVIYRARDLKLHRAVAVKFIAPELRGDSEARRRFVAEARAASALDHPNICTIHEIAETDDGRPFIVMAAYDGETLRSRIDRGPVPADEALAIADPIARALAAAHERGIVHRDVKPDNVFLTDHGTVKLLDFGLARTTGGAMSGTEGVRGTVAYMSPEQALGRRADERSDVWALGVILFEMLTGARPFSGCDLRATTNRILTVKPDLGAARPDLAAGVVDVVHRALEKDPGRRFTDGRAFRQALRELGAVPATSRASRRSRPLMLGIAPAAVVLLVIATVASFRVRSAGEPTLAAGPPPVSHVLWVDDNPENNLDVVEQFEDRGVRVTTVLSTEEALRGYDPDEQDLVISDMGRYEGVGDTYVEEAGYDLLTGLRARHRDVQLVFCTSARRVEMDGGKAVAAGALDIVGDCDDILVLVGL
jgi:tRNA A-37 threonylcarbamoyl transferase component Bud32